MTQQSHSRYLSKKKESIQPHKNLYTNVYRGFIYNCLPNGNDPNVHQLRVAKQTGTSTQWDTSQELKRNRLPTHMPKWWITNGFCQVKKVRCYWMISFTRHLVKAKCWRKNYIDNCWGLKVILTIEDQEGTLWGAAHGGLHALKYVSKTLELYT